MRKKEIKKGVERRCNKRQQEDKRQAKERGREGRNNIPLPFPPPCPLPFPFPPPIFVNVLCVWQCGDERSVLFSLFCFFPALIFPFSPFSPFPAFPSLLWCVSRVLCVVCVCACLFSLSQLEMTKSYSSTHFVLKSHFFQNLCCLATFLAK